ncbi:MAG: PepSY-associated TM helix domain-containing protein [Rhodospirillaceae bacterium]|nr:PepSY-associated TM helix domain-containing protein [Rhodospirillaceae bacterium]
MTDTASGLGADLTAAAAADAATPTRASAWTQLRVVHKVCGLAALAWLSVLGGTGWILNHHDWRWSHQWTVPGWVTSPQINRLVRGTIMRHIVMDPADASQLVGASERGLWWTADRGATWTDTVWIGVEGLPQTYDLVPSVDGGFDRIWAATDDGIWQVEGGGRQATRFALAGQHVTALSPGSRPGELIGAVDEGRIFRLDTATPDAIAWTDVHDVVVTGLPDTVPLNRFTLDLHVGRGFLPGEWSLIVNDYGGIAILVLSLTGILFWWLPRKWRHEKPKGKLKARQKALRWIYRGHAPVIGLLAVVPILYVSITGIMVDHIQTLITYGKDVKLPRAALPPLYDYANLEGEVSDVVAVPGEPARIQVASRFGILDSADGGQTWAMDRSLPLAGDDDGSRYNLFRVGDRVFVGIGNYGQYSRRDGETAWTELALNGPKLAITSATVQGNTWYLKNSRAIYAGRLGATFEDSAIAYPPVTGTTWFLFLADIHTGHIFRIDWSWINDIVAVLAIALTLTGPVLWWRRKWA